MSDSWTPMFSRRVNLLVVVLVIFSSCGKTAQAGRLGDKLHQKLEELHQRRNPGPVAQMQPTNSSNFRFNPLQNLRGSQVTPPQGGHQVQIGSQVQQQQQIAARVQQQPMLIQGPQTGPQTFQGQQLLKPVQIPLGQVPNLGVQQHQQEQRPNLSLDSLRPVEIAPMTLKPTPKPTRPTKTKDDSDDDAVVIKDDDDAPEQQSESESPKIPGAERDSIKGAIYCGKDESFDGKECRSDA